MSHLTLPIIFLQWGSTSIPIWKSSFDDRSENKTETNSRLILFSPTFLLSYLLRGDFEHYSFLLMCNYFTVGRGIILKDPSGTTVTAEKIILSQASVYQITKPAIGYWTLEISEDTVGGYEFSVKSSSYTNIDFRHYFMIPLGRGRRKAVVPFANPVTGLCHVYFCVTKLV